MGDVGMKLLAEIDRLKVASVKSKVKSKARSEVQRVELYRLRYGDQFRDVFAAIDRCGKKPNGAVRSFMVRPSLRNFLGELHRKNLAWARTWGNEIIKHVRHADERGYKP